MHLREPNHFSQQANLLATCAIVFVCVAGIVTAAGNLRIHERSGCVEFRQPVKRACELRP